MCRSLNVSDSNLPSCIFDVAVTNDTTFTDQENFKQGTLFYFQTFSVIRIKETFHALVPSKEIIDNILK